MQPGIEELNRFYATADGRRVAMALRSVVWPMLRRQANARLLALGFVAPVIDGLAAGAIERIAVAMPAAQGCVDWPRHGATNAALAVMPGDLPFPGAAFDQAIVCHAIEFGDAAAMLGEVARTLAPAGDIIAIVANRAGLWTHFEWTPFGQGQPYGKAGLARLLADAGFEPVSWWTTLVAPPLRGLRRLDRVLTRLLPTLGGVHIVRARKSGGPAAKPIGRVRAVPGVAAATACAAADGSP
jgi:SAM-dependent methyltransferase